MIVALGPEFGVLRACVSASQKHSARPQGGLLRWPRPRREKELANDERPFASPEENRRPSCRRASGRTESSSNETPGQLA